MLANIMRKIHLQCIHRSNHHAVHFHTSQFSQLYPNEAEVKNPKYKMQSHKMLEETLG